MAIQEAIKKVLLKIIKIIIIVNKIRGLILKEVKEILKKILNQIIKEAQGIIKTLTQNKILNLIIKVKEIIIMWKNKKLEMSKEGTEIIYQSLHKKIKTNIKETTIIIIIIIII